MQRIRVLRQATIEYIEKIGGFSFADFMNSPLEEMPYGMEWIVLLDLYTHKSGIAYSDFKNMSKYKKLGPNDISSIRGLGVYMVPSCELIEVNI